MVVVSIEHWIAGVVVVRAGADLAYKAGAKSPSILNRLGVVILDWAMAVGAFNKIVHVVPFHYLI